MPTDSIAVQVRSLSRVFGARRALDRLDLEIPAGEFLTILGSNGAGKTTFLKILAGLARPSAGQVEIFGTDLRGDGADEVRGRIGMVGHASLLYARLSARENLVFHARLFGVQEPGARALWMLEQMNLADRADDPAGTFSRGMLQRLSIARALIHDPDLLLLDEPFTGLDPYARENLADLLAGVHGRGRTVIMTSHDLEMGRRLASRVVLIRRGRVALDERPEEVTEQQIIDVLREDSSR